jgi:hypothetical protein
LYSSIESELQLAASSDGDNRFREAVWGYSNRTDSEMHGGDLPARASAEGGIFAAACSRKQEEIENLLLLPPASRK